MTNRRQFRSWNPIQQFLTNDNSRLKANSNKKRRASQQANGVSAETLEVRTLLTQAVIVDLVDVTGSTGATTDGYVNEFDQIQGYLYRELGDINDELTVSIQSSHPSLLEVPPSVVIPAGQNIVAFPVTLHDQLGVLTGDYLLTVTSTSSVPGFPDPAVSTDSLTLLDWERYQLSLDVAGLEVGDSATGTLSLNYQLSTPATITLSSTSDELVVPSTVQIPAGVTSVTFPVQAVDNGITEGNRAETIDALVVGSELDARFWEHSVDVQVAEIPVATLPVNSYGTGLDGDGDGTIDFVQELGHRVAWYAGSEYRAEYEFQTAAWDGGNVEAATLELTVSQTLSVLGPAGDLTIEVFGHVGDGLLTTDDLNDLTTLLGSFTLPQGDAALGSYEIPLDVSSLVPLLSSSATVGLTFRLVDPQSNGYLEYSFAQGWDGAGPAPTLKLTGSGNAAPVIDDQTFVIPEGSTYPTVAGVVTATDPDNDPLSIVILSGNEAGHFFMNNGVLRVGLNVDLNYEAQASYPLTVQATDTFGHASTATITINLSDVNEAPTADAASFSGDEDTTVNGALSGSDVEGSALTFALVSGPSNGSLTLNGDGTFSYSPDTEFSGNDSFSFVANDGELDSAPATVSINIAAVDDAPVANAASFVGNEDAPIVGTLSGYDVEGATLTFSSVASPAHGSLTLNSDGTFSYSPLSNFNGSDSFTFLTNDGTNNSSPATVMLTVAAVADPPRANGFSTGATEDTVKSGTLSGSDPDGDPITFVLVGVPVNGVATVASNGPYTFTPNSDFVGSASFQFRTFDGTSYSTPANVTLTVSNVNDAPIAADDVLTATEDTTLRIEAGGVTRLSMVSEPGDWIGQGLTYDLTPGTGTFTTGFQYTAKPDSGIRGRYTGATGDNWTLVFDAPNSEVLTEGTFTGAIRAPFNGELAGLSVSGNGRGSNTLTGEFTVRQLLMHPGGIVRRFAADFEQHSEGNAPALLGTYEFNYSANDSLSSILDNDTDVDFSGASAVLVSGPSHGTLSLEFDGELTYVPDPNFSGTDSFTYLVTDGQLQSAPATVTINVADTNDAPFASDASFSTDEDTSLNGVLIGSDIEGSVLNFELVSGPSNGSLTLNGDGTFSYSPDGNFNGSDSFTFRTNDGELNSATATVSLDIAAVNDAPSANAASFSGDEDSTVNGALSGSDVEGSALTFALVSGPSNGSLTLNGDGTFSYSPDGNFNGSDSFTFRTNDGELNSATATVSLDIAAVNDAPSANAASFSGDEDSTVNGALSGSDVEGSALTFALVSGPSNGSLTLNGDGTFSYSPDGDFNGNDSFTFRTNDSELNSATATVSLDIAAVNDAPIADAGSFSGDEDSTVNGALSGSDVEGSALTFALVSGPSNGSLTLNGDGTFSYSPDGNFNGSDSFTFQTNDGELNSATATVSLNIAAVNDAPSADAASFSLDENSATGTAVGTVAANDVDAGDSLSFAITDGNYGGSFAIDSTTGAITVADPALLDFETTPQFDLTVTVTDSGGLTASAPVTISLIDVAEVTPTKFYVVDITSDSAFRYDASGGALASSSLNNPKSRGVAADISGTTYWVVDANKIVYVYDAQSGTELGSWQASGLSKPQGITTDGTDIWIVDNRLDKVFHFAGAASRLSGSQSADSSFAVNRKNRNAKGIVTDGSSIWTVQSAGTDKVFKYSMDGTLQGYWNISGGNTSPTGIAIDPVNVDHIWIVDNASDSVYQYSGAANQTSGTLTADATFALAAGNTNPQGIADPPPPSVSLETLVTDTSSIEVADSSGETVSFPVESFPATNSPSAFDHLRTFGQTAGRTSSPYVVDDSQADQATDDSGTDSESNAELSDSPESTFSRDAAVDAAEFDQNDSQAVWTLFGDEAWLNYRSV